MARVSDGQVVRMVGCGGSIAPVASTPPMKVCKRALEGEGRKQRRFSSIERRVHPPLLNFTRSWRTCVQAGRIMYACCAYACGWLCRACCACRCTSSSVRMYRARNTPRRPIACMRTRARSCDWKSSRARRPRKAAAMRVAARFAANNAALAMCPRPKACTTAARYERLALAVR